MNIWLPIITNLIMLGILVAGIFVGKKNGWKVELSKLIIMLGVGVGLYFLAPVITNALLSIETLFQAQQQIPYLVQAINSLIIFVLFMIVYMIVSLIASAIHKKVVAKQNGIAYIRLKGKGNGKINRANKREFRRRIKEAKKQKKTSQVVGAILGFVMAALITFVLFMPIKYMFKGLSNIDNNFESGFEYTVWGQLDNVTDMYDIINNRVIIDVEEDQTVTIDIGE